MPITSSDITFYLSGGTSNSDPDAALGGAISETEVGAGLENLFANALGAEAAAGSVKYRCFYVQNDHGSLTLIDTLTWISQLTTSEDDEIAIGLDPAGVNGTATTVANEDSAPAGVSFSTPTNSGAGLDIGDLEPGEFQAIWVRRTVDSAADPIDSNTCRIIVRGSTTE